MIKQSTHEENIETLDTYPLKNRLNIHEGQVGRATKKIDKSIFIVEDFNKVLSAVR